MSNENNELVIFEYSAFRERLRECASSLPTWTSTIHTLLDKHDGEKNLNKLVEGLTSDTHPSEIIAAWNEISKNGAEHNKRIAAIIKDFEDRNVLNPSKKPLDYLLHALTTLYNYTSNPHLDANRAESDKISSIRLALNSELEKAQSSAFPEVVFDDSTKQSEVFQDTHAQETNLQNLQKKFREELDYIAKGDETDNIFRDVKEIGDDIIPKIVGRLRTIVGNETFRKDLDKFRTQSEQDIDEFIYKAQSNIDKQIKATLDELEKGFQNMLESEIRLQFQQVAPYLGLFVSTEGKLKEVREDIENWQEQTEVFIAEFFQLPKDIQDSCERFREDFKCLETLEKYEQNPEIDSKEVETLKHLFGANGTNIFSRVNCEPEDLTIPENVEKIAIHVEEKIDNRYRWQNRAIFASSTELIRIFEYATTRLKDIDNYLVGISYE